MTTQPPDFYESDNNQDLFDFGEDTLEVGTELYPPAEDVVRQIEAKERIEQRRWDKMDADFDLYQLEEWIPHPDESIGAEDIYTTNEPRVLAEKIIAFISNTVPVVIADNSDAREEQEEINDLTEALAIGMLNNADSHLRRNGQPSVQDQLAFFTTVRGKYAAVRAILRKRQNQDTYEDILPLDPRHLIVQSGDGEMLWAAYRMQRTVADVEEEFPGFEFGARSMEGDDAVEVWEYYCRVPNEMNDPMSDDPFERHPYRYEAGTIIDNRWARPKHDLFMLSFPIVVAPVSSQPQLTPTDNTDSPDVTFGESIFAENRAVWNHKNRAMSQINNLMAKAVDPRQKVFSTDGTKTLDDGSQEPGAEINLSVADGQDIVNFVEADINASAQAFLQQTNVDSVAGGLPPQAFGLLDKPLSSVALRQLGNNLEHRVLPRMKAVARCIEGAIENLITQYETGSFFPITVSGRRYDNHRFANRQIDAVEIAGHDPIEVRMDLALPEDEVSRWTVAQMASQPTATGEPMASLEWVRENILKMQSHKKQHRQNMEAAALQNSQVAQALHMFESAIRDGDRALAAIWFDQLQVMYMQQQVQGYMAQQQLAMAAQGLPIVPLENLLSEATGFVRENISNQAKMQSDQMRMQARANQSANPANGAVPYSQRTGMGNNPAPDAGYNTTAPRQRQSGLYGVNGQQLLLP